MHNNTSLICLLNNPGIDILIWQIGAFLLPILGIPGHILLIITSLTSNRRRFHPTCLYFISISITESIYLLFLFWDWLDVVNLAPDPRQILDCALFYPFVSGTGFISLVLLVQLNLDRIFIIHKPQQIYLYLTYKRISIKILLTFCLLFLFIFHYRFSVHYDSKSFIIFGQSCRVYNHARLWFYFIWPYLHLFFRLTLCLIIIVCTIYIFYNRCYEKSDRKMFLHRRRRQQTFSLVLVLLSIYTFLAVIPISILQIFNQHMWKYESECFFCYNCMENNIQAKKWKLINAICIMWESSIYMNKFYIKLIFSSDFRSDLKQLIFCRSTNGMTSKMNSMANRSSLE
jgi:hypothetical protein